MSQVLMLWCLSIILSAATIVHCVVFGVCNVPDFIVLLLMFIMLFSPFLWIVLPPPLHSFACWSFVGGGRLLDGCFGQKLYSSSTLIVFPKLIHFCSF